ncbi:MAG: polymerase III tau and gamma subunit protein [Candidatus Giovannonibacteria bacterium GW2011_GWA2_53_7]|uniref:Polymerase III tau and gamma subunit protein n=1 Tax=Candidatus Giovannonibacteria bacterium GW2011_GWA2_53_7 TaxID=1618650 RepID=A0A0G2A8D5_9BACT|nr:MAG: polymerase III tau and gamma subunit protein [Candidatus Giovannonibacteria bacterium GW2011_GWA2_53_7]
MDAIIGHESHKKVFERLIENGSLSHAYLFVGPESIGKTTFIRALTSQLLGVPDEKLAMNADVSWVTCPVDEKTGIQKATLSVEIIRDLREALSMGAFLGGYRVAVIEDASAMTPSAGNALLKMLEEPPKRTVLFLRAKRVEDVPRTIVSRTQIIRLELVSSEDIVKALILRGASRKEADELANIALGRPGIALSFLTDRQAYADWRTQADVFEQHLDTGIAERLTLARNLLSKDDQKDHARGERIFTAWEFVLRKKLRAEPEGLRWVQGLDRLARSRTAFSRHTSLQLAFEHTLLHL